MIRSHKLNTYFMIGNSKRGCESVQGYLDPNLRSPKTRGAGQDTMGPEMAKSETGKSIRQYNAAKASVDTGLQEWAPRVDHTDHRDPLRSINFCWKV